MSSGVALLGALGVVALIAIVSLVLGLHPLLVAIPTSILLIGVIGSAIGNAHR